MGRTRGQGQRPRKARPEVLLAQGKGPVKRTQLNPFDAAGCDDREYEVEKILGTRTNYGEQQWLINWKDFGEGTDAWEPLKNLHGHEAEIEAFHTRSEEEQDAMAKKNAEEKAKKRKEREADSEQDQEFRDIFYEIFKEGYTPPSYKTVIDKVLTLSAEGKEKRYLFRLFVTLLVELEAASKKACASMGLGVYREIHDTDATNDQKFEDTVCEAIHCTAVSDNASNIVSGWVKIDGHECVAHTLALIVKAFLDEPFVKKVFGKLRGMTGHFNHSVIGVRLLYDCQKRQGLTQSKPPQDNGTRSGWGGACKQAKWYLDNREAVQMYDIEHTTKAANAVPNLDGSVYNKDHKLDSWEWDIVRTFTKEKALNRLKWARKAFARKTGSPRVMLPRAL
eukprot:gene7745-biopygen7824